MRGRPLLKNFALWILIPLALGAASAAQTASSGSSVVTYTKLVDFGEGNGQYPNVFIAQATDGNFYSTAYRGGTYENGAVFKMTPNGAVTVLYSFCPECQDGKLPESGVIEATDGTFYGTTLEEGDGRYRNANSGGTIYTITSAGSYATLYNFCSLLGCRDGSNPGAPLVQASDGNFYGVTGGGGKNHNAGTVFRITPQGNLTTLYSFCAQTNCADGSFPQGLILASDGNFYGVALAGGNGAFCLYSTQGGCGTIFKITPQGKFTTLYNFCSQANCPDGYYPVGRLVQSSTDGKLYGRTDNNGQYGTIFSLSSIGAFTTLHLFCSLPNCADGDSPTGLIQANDGNFYGTAAAGGSNGRGTAFEITSTGTLTTLYNFCSQGGKQCSDGEGPQGMIQGTDGTFYGVTYSGGRAGHGVAFQLATGLGALP
jgi:uncharacterized repeat protein (TIGR03803 family)